MDDDGEGINGVGFRPSAAIEWRRRETRKRQVSDWRAREAKEERRRRFERRRNEGAVGVGVGGRKVSFAGLGEDGAGVGTDVAAAEVGAVEQTGLGPRELQCGDEHAQYDKRAKVRFAGTA